MMMMIYPFSLCVSSSSHHHSLKSLSSKRLVDLSSSFFEIFLSLSLSISLIFKIW